MALNFPAAPTVGQKYPPSPIVGVPVYAWDGEKWTTNGGATAVGAPPYNGIPPMDGAGASGTSINYARGDHQHPSDTTRAPIASPTFTGTVTAPGWHVTGSATIDGNIAAATLTTSGNATVGGALNGATLNIGNSAVLAPAVIRAATNENVAIYNNGGRLAMSALNDASAIVPWDIYGNPLAFHGAVSFDTIPTSPTPTAGDNSTKVATTAFVLANVPTGSFLPIAGGTITGALTVNGGVTLNGGMSGNTGQFTFFQPAGTIAQTSGSNVEIRGAGAGSQAMMTFHNPNSFAGNFGMDTSGRFYKGGYSFGASTSYQFWTQQDFASIPVANARLTFTSDVAAGGAVGEISGAVITGADNKFTFRYRYLQIFTTSWFTVGVA